MIAKVLLMALVLASNIIAYRLGFRNGKLRALGWVTDLIKSELQKQNSEKT